MNTAIAGETVVTFANMTHLNIGGVDPSELSTFQLILRADGSIVFGYAELNAKAPGVKNLDNSLDSSSQLLIGISNKFGESGYNSSQLAAVSKGFAQPLTSCDSNGCHDTVYQTVLNPVVNTAVSGLELAGTNLVFTPTNSQSARAWQVSNADLTGVPEPSTVCELLIAMAGCVMLRRKSTQS